MNKKNILIIISLNRSGTNYFFDNIQNITNYKLYSYYEIFNDAFYNKAGKWDDYFKKYNCSCKLEVLDKISSYGKGYKNPLNYKIENDSNTITSFKIFPKHLSEEELLLLLKNDKYNIRIIFMVRNIKSIYNSLYRSLEKNDWTSKRSYKLEDLDWDILLKNNKIKSLHESKEYECFLHDKIQLITKLKIKHKIIYFIDYKNYEIKDYEKLIQDLFS